MKALHQTIDYFCSMKDYELPEFFVVTGDLSEGGTREGYEFMREGLRKLPRPVYIVPGNHDKRDFFLEMFYRGNSGKRGYQTLYLLYNR